MIILALIFTSQISRAGLIAWTTGEIFSTVEESEAHGEMIKTHCRDALEKFLATTHPPPEDVAYAEWRERLFRRYTAISGYSEYYFTSEAFDRAVPVERPRQWPWPRANR